MTPTSLEDGRRLLGASVLFRKLASRERNELVARAHMCRFEAGDTSNPAAWRGLIEVLCSRMRRTDQHLVELALLELPARLAKALLRVVDAERGPPAAHLTGAECHLSQSELATIVGATRESVNKCLHAWQRTGIVRMKKRAIKVADRAALEALAELQ